MNGLVFDIQRFSIHDGPGIRTTVFLKGCSLRCFWCHNPESIRPKPELQSFPTKCIGCGECVTACPEGVHAIRDGERVMLWAQCVACGRCVEACFPGALVMAGKSMSSDEVVTEVLRDRAFYERSGGGVTLSGGEPALQKEFSREILSACKDQGIHTAIETAANCRWDDLEELLSVTDLVMMDIKHIDSEKHRAATGVSNERILANAERLAASGKPIIFRVPVIPTVNDSPEEIGAIASFVKRIAGGSPDIRLELLPFHRLAADKYRSLGLEYRAGQLPELDKARMEMLRDIGCSMLTASPPPYEGEG